MVKTYCIAVLLLSAAVLHAEETNITLTVDGITYSNVTFGATTPTTVKVFHSSGILTVLLEKLPPEIQQQLGYDPEKATRYRTAQQAAKQKAEIARAIEALAIQILGKVIQATRSGALLDASILVANTATNEVAGNVTSETRVIEGFNGRKYTSTTTRTGPSSLSIRTYTNALPVGLIYIRGLVNVHDDDQWEGRVFADGDHEYTTVQGAYKKVRAFTLEPPVLP